MNTLNSLSQVNDSIGAELNLALVLLCISHRRTKKTNDSITAVLRRTRELKKEAPQAVSPVKKIASKGTCALLSCGWNHTAVLTEGT